MTYEEAKKAAETVLTHRESLWDGAYLKQIIEGLMKSETSSVETP